MPDPNAHADDMKSPTEYVPPPVKDKDTLPPLWWLNPWNTVLALLYKVDHLKATSRGEQAARIDANIATQRLGKENAELKAALATALDDATELNHWNDELIRKTNEAKADLLTTKAELDALKSGEEQALQHANEQLAEARSAYDRLWNAVHAETPGICFDGHGPAGWMKNVVKQLAEARRLATEYLRERDAARDSLTVAKEHIANMDEKMHKEQLDHAATLGYVRKVEAQLKRTKPAAKPAKKNGVSK